MEKKLLTIGIVCDNYKLDRFKKKLTKAGYEYTCTPFTAETTTIKIQAPPEKVQSVKTLCQEVEYHFKRSN